MIVFSKPTVKRLVQLEFLLGQKLDKNTEHTQNKGGGKETSGGVPATLYITSKELAELTGWTDATIRKDISHLGIKGGASKGYKLDELYKAIHQAVGKPQEGMTAESLHPCCIVGLGRIGAALLDYGGFAQGGMKLVAGFDESVNRVEILNASFPLYPASRLEQVIAQQRIEYAVLTVPEQDAPVYGKRLAEAGIKGIVNYTSAVLNLGDNVAVENISLAEALKNCLFKANVS